MNKSIHMFSLKFNSHEAVRMKPLLKLNIKDSSSSKISSFYVRKKNIYHKEETNHANVCKKM